MKKYVANSTEKDLSDTKSSTRNYNSYFLHDENLEPSDQLKTKNEKKENEKPEKQVVGVFELFRYADCVDVLLLVFGLIAAVANGTEMSLMVIVYGDMTNSLMQSRVQANVLRYYYFFSPTDTSANSCSCPTIPSIDIESEMTKYAYNCVGIGFAGLVLSTIQAWTFLVAAKRQTARIWQFFFAVLHQKMAWFDSAQIGTLNTRLTEQDSFFHEGISDKICIFVQFFATFLAGIITGFTYRWKLTLVIFSVSPLLAASAAVWSSLLASITAKKLPAYAEAVAVAKEILTAVRTVVAFNGQQKALAKFDASLEVARSVGLEKSITTNTSLSVSQFLIFGPYALAFWYGTKLTAEDENYDISHALIVFSVCIALTLGAAPNLEKAANARGAAYEVYQIINKKPLIDSSSKEGYKPDRLIGETEFRNIHFGYPSRLDVKVSVQVPQKVTGKTIALVGASGCGKITAIQLLQRFYDPVEGEITLDGWDIWKLNVKCLQENIGIVSQEPPSFATVAKNIRYGQEDISDAETEQAAKEANAFGFISRLPDKFNTMVRERGAQLSGGQEQVAIARALARNSNIFLLDGATSTLDTQSESIVQAALDKVLCTVSYEFQVWLKGSTEFATFIDGFMFGKSGEILTMRLHSLSDKALLQQIGWYDDQKNAVGVLLTWLATDASQVKGATGSDLDWCLTVLILLTAIIIAFVYTWQLTLLVLPCIPFLVATNAVSLSSMSGHAAKDQKALEEAGRISTETAENIRTVASLTKEEVFSERVASLNCPYTWDSIMFAPINIGQSTSLAPDYGKAKLSTQTIFKHVDRKPLMNSYSEEGEKLSNFEGNIEFTNIHFAYPARPDVQVLQGLSVKVNKGQTLALVGSSSCSKSASIQLLERFYNPVEGQVLADGCDTRSLHIQWLRSRLGLVSQEHILFDCSIAENIRYGDNSKVVSQDRAEEAAKAANIHSFIERLIKYNTPVGEKGTQLSEGQKQRITIAHTLVHNPAILLLDEADSALDTSEKVVQKALDNAWQGTCIIIAHLLTTIQTADIITVIQNGRVVEQGTRRQLLEKKEHYYALVNAQESNNV
ncbi:LOW QUALITY PROTEIN: ATP-binding cassette sub-family B member 5 [Ara ararauna]